jgi:hypothetical protein
MPKYKFYLKAMHPLSGTGSDWLYDWFSDGADNILSDPGSLTQEWHRFYPGVSRDLAIEYDIWDHKHRRKLKGDLTFINNQIQLDYSILSKIVNESMEIKIRIEQSCMTTASDWWEGYFSIVDGKWDADRGILTISANPDDEYRKFEEQGDKEFNLVDLNGTLSSIVSYPIEHQMIMSQVVDAGTSNNAYEAAWPNLKDANRLVVPPPIAGDTWDNWYQWAPVVIDGFNWRLRWYRDICKVALSDDFIRNTEAVMFSSDYLMPQFLHEYPTDESGEGYQFFSNKHNGKNRWGDMVASDWIDVTGGDSIPTNDFRITLNPRGFLMKDAIQYIVGALSPGTTYVSSFFDNSPDIYGSDILPIGYNYVTGVLSELNELIMFQKSDIFPTSDPAKVGKITFNDFMDGLKNTFNIDWFIDINGDFRIEHWSYFENTYGSDLDLTVLDGGKWAFHKNKFSYELGTMPNMERFSFPESYHDDFVGKDIIYNRVATFNRYKDNVSEVSVPWTTDIIYAYGHKDAISNDGWILLATKTYDDGNRTHGEIGQISGDFMMNGHLSWANLHYNYWRHGRVLINGNMNGSDIIFLSSQRHIKQEEITYPECCGTFDPMAYKVTGLGEGEVREAEYRLIDGSVKTVFFYHSVNKSAFPEAETYFILINGVNRLLFNDSDKLIWYG